MKLHHLFPAILAVFLLPVNPALAADSPADNPVALVTDSVTTLQDLATDSQMGTFRQYLKSAKGVLIIPLLVKAGFIVGIEGGNGVLMLRDAKSGRWNGPAFYSLGSGSVGLQIGAQVSKVVLLIMTRHGVNSLFNTSFKLGADASIAAGPVGGGVGTDIPADIISFGRSKGAFAGVSLSGGLVSPANELNRRYYGHTINLETLLNSGKPDRLQADRLRSELARLAR